MKRSSISDPTPFGRARLGALALAALALETSDEVLQLVVPDETLHAAEEATHGPDENNAVELAQLGTVDLVLVGIPRELKEQEEQRQ